MTDFVVKTSDLDAEFKISKNTRVTRLAMVGLHPDRLHKEGKSYWLTQDQYDLFVDFDKYIQDTGSTKDYPHLFINSAESLPRSRESAQEGGELATVAANELSAEPINLDTDPFTETFSTGFASPRADELLAQQITENAKHRATSILMAESAIANHYLQNPDLLDPEFRAQINSISIPKIDPKGLAASLIRGVKMNIGAA
jgi:hypothetical protein